jgi:hypothetical protein
MLCFPNIDGVDYTKQDNDADYGQRFYTTKVGEGGSIQHAAGPLWGWGGPLDSDVWEAMAYEEKAFTYQPGDTELLILDSRWQGGDGTLWRQIGKFGETAKYAVADLATVRMLDQVLDGACLRPAE